jgi:hypothetical protein
VIVTIEAFFTPPFITSSRPTDQSRGAHTQDDYARMLLSRGAGADREKGQECLDAALATYRELGMENHWARASALAVDAPRG